MQLKPGESLRLPEFLREELSKPVGKIYNENELKDILKNKKVISIGDETTLTMLRLGIKTLLSIFDLKTKRRILSYDIIDNFSHRLIVTNPPGYITYEMFQSVKYALDNGINAIQVIGEEDLASLVCIEILDYGVTIIYGIPNMGLGLIEIDENIKNRTEEVLNKMVIENGT